MDLRTIDDFTASALVDAINEAPTARTSFETISKLAENFGFESCVVFEAIMSVVSVSEDNESGLQADSIQMLFSNHTKSHDKLVTSFFDNLDPYNVPSAFEFYQPPFLPFATGSNWHRDHGDRADEDLTKTYDLLDQVFGPTGGIGFPIQSAQTNFSPVVCLVMVGRFSSDWLAEFLELIVPGLAPVISAFERKMYPELIEAERQRVALTTRELQCLELIARGSNTKKIAYSLGITTAMTSRHLRHAQSKLRVPNVASAVLKAQKLGLVFL